jgi:hypothetical protein
MVSMHGQHGSDDQKQQHAYDPFKIASLLQRTLSVNE